jgi:hypothetical protein
MEQAIDAARARVTRHARMRARARDPFSFLQPAFSRAPQRGDRTPPRRANRKNSGGWREAVGA